LKINFSLEESHPVSGNISLIVIGHEFFAEVVEAGAGVSKFKPGEWLVVEQTFSCGECEAGRSPKYNLCEGLGIHGLSDGGGGFSSFTVVNKQMVHRMPNGLSFELGAVLKQCININWRISSKRALRHWRARSFGLAPQALTTLFMCITSAQN